MPIFPRLRSFRTAIPFYLALFLLVLSLLASYLFGYVLLLSFRETNDLAIEEMRERRKSVAEATSKRIPDLLDSGATTLLNTLLDIKKTNLPKTDQDWRATFKDSESGVYPPNIMEQLDEKLLSLKQDTESHRLTLIDTHQRVIANADSLFMPGDPAPIVKGNERTLALAMTGKTTYTMVVHDDKPYFQVFTPVIITGRKNEYVGGILLMETDYSRFSRIEEIEKQGLAIGLIVTALSIMIALLFYRLLRTFASMNEMASQNDRLQAMGTLAAGIAHEIRNPLGIIRVMAEALRDDFSEEDPRREIIDDITDEVNRLGNLVTQYLHFARPDPSKPGEYAKPNEVILSLTHLLKKGDRDKQQIIIEMPENLPAVQMNESSMRQVLLNLIVNAQDACKDNCPITIKCSYFRARGQVQILVEDKGAGISPRELKRVFDPFYTTRDQGTGLGLALSRQMITECRGKITIDSKQGEGTTVRVILPVAERAPQEMPPPPE